MAVAKRTREPSELGATSRISTSLAVAMARRSPRSEKQGRDVPLSPPELCASRAHDHQTRRRAPERHRAAAGGHLKPPIHGRPPLAFNAWERVKSMSGGRAPPDPVSWAGAQHHAIVRSGERRSEKRDHRECRPPHAAPSIPVDSLPGDWQDNGESAKWALGSPRGGWVQRPDRGCSGSRCVRALEGSGGPAMLLDLTIGRI